MPCRAELTTRRWKTQLMTSFGCSTLEEASRDAPTSSMHGKRPEADDIKIRSQMGMPEELPLTEEEVRAMGVLLRTEGDRLLEQVRNDHDYDDSIKKVTNGNSLPKEWRREGGILYQLGKVVIPRSMDIRKEILRMHHDNAVSGHPGQARTGGRP
jgi:hypothetical protein